MDTLTFVSNALSAFAWPVAVIVAVWLLRREIRALAPSLSKLRYKDLELEFGRRVREIEDTASTAANDDAPSANPAPVETRMPNEILADLLLVSPRVAVIEAFTFVEQAIRAAAMRRGLVEGDMIGVRHAAKKLKKDGLMSEPRYRLFQQLRELRNMLSHSSSACVSRDDATSYIDQALSLAGIVNCF